MFICKTNIVDLILLLYEDNILIVFIKKVLTKNINTTTHFGISILIIDIILFVYKTRRFYITKRGRYYKTHRLLQNEAVHTPLMIYILSTPRYIHQYLLEIVVYYRRLMYIHCRTKINCHITPIICPPHLYFTPMVSTSTCLKLLSQL